MAAITFQVLRRDKSSLARAGLLHTPHGTVETPAFIPVGSQATVKGLTPDEVRALGAQIVLANTYHLYLRPGADLIGRLGGLHRFMGWNGPIITDSGGYQVFSFGVGREQGVGKIAKIFPGQEELGEELRPRGGGKPKLAQVDENGVTFTSHIDGSTHRFTPERSIRIQEELGADIMLAFDECTSPLATYDYTKESMDRTHHWAQRCLEAKTSGRQALFGIVQGGEYRDLREASAQFIASLPFEGYAIGGSLGKSKEDMHRVLEWTIPLLPEDKPRHLLGIGEPDDLLEGIKRGIDLFDCAMPTRIGRHGVVYTRQGRLHITNAEYREDQKPPEENCRCYACQHFSRAYLHHLFRSGELLAPRLATIHNIHFIISLVKELRQAILEDRFPLE